MANEIIYIDKINYQTIQLLKDRNQLIHENLFNFSQEYNEVIEITKDVLNISLSCNSTYFHFIANTLPYIITYITRSKNKNFDFVIDTNIFNHILELLFDNRIHTQSMYTVYFCSKLILPDIYDFNNNFGWNKYDIQKQQDVYNHIPEQLILTRNFILEKINDKLKSNTYEKIFIYRESEHRKSEFMNNKEFINEFKKLGFTFLSLDNIDFITQVNLFYNAKIIISEAGSCCANMMFMKENMKYVLIASNSEFIDHSFFKTYADIFKIKLTYILTEAQYKNQDILKNNNFEYIQKVGLENIL